MRKEKVWTHNAFNGHVEKEKMMKEKNEFVKALRKRGIKYKYERDIMPPAGTTLMLTVSWEE